MRRNFRRADVIAATLLFIAIFLAAVADNTNESKTTAEQRLKTWTKTSAVVTPGETDKPNQTIVTVTKPDGTTAQTYLAATDAHPPGEKLTVYFDPAKGFPFKSPHGNPEVVAESQLNAAIAPSMEKLAILEWIGAVLAGLGAIFFGVRAVLQRYRKVSAGMSDITTTNIGEPSPEQAAILDATPGHEGNPRQVAVRFFAAAPTEIGKIISAESTFPKTGAKSVVQNLIAGAILAAMIVGGFWWGASLDKTSSDNNNIRIFGIGLRLAVLAGTIFQARFRAMCSYVGDRGIAKFDVSKPWGKLQLRQLQFDQATALRTGYVRKIVNGAYTGTVYHFTWSKADGSPAFYIEGRYKDSKPLPEGDPLRLLRAAETVWSRYVLIRSKSELAKTGVIQFPVDDRLTVQVGKGEIRFVTKGQVETARAADIASIDLADGQFLIKHKDAKWYSRAGKYSFPYSEMPNAKVFLLALENLLGVKL